MNDYEILHHVVDKKPWTKAVGIGGHVHRLRRLNLRAATQVLELLSVLQQLAGSGAVGLLSHNAVRAITL